MDIPCGLENLVGFLHGLSRQLPLPNTAFSTSYQDNKPVSKDHESRLLSENLPLILPGKTKKPPALKLGEWVSGA